MKFWGVVAIFVVGVFAFVVGQRLSADAVGMAVGVLFGVLAGVPAAILVLASSRRRQEAEYDDDDEVDDVDHYGARRGRRSQGYAQQPYGALPAQAPVIVFAPPSAPPPASPHQYGYPNQYVNSHAGPPALPGPTVHPSEARRAFKVVGEQEEWISEW